MRENKTLKSLSARQRFFINGAVLTAVALAIRTVELGFNAFVSRKIGTEALGLYTIIGTVYAFAVTFATSGISLTVTRLVASAIGEERRGDIRRIVQRAVAYALAFSSLAALVLFFLARPIAYRAISEPRAVVPLRVLACSLVPLALSSVLTGYFVGARAVARNALVRILAQSFRILVSVALVLRLAPRGAEYAVIALCLGTVLTELFTFLLSLAQFILSPPPSASDESSVSLRDLTRVALPLAFSAYVRSALMTVEHALIPAKLRERGESASSALSSYGLLHGMALPVVLYPLSPLSSFAGLLVPELAESDARGDERRLARICTDVCSATLRYSAPVAVFLLLFAEEIGFALYSSFSAGRYIAMLAPVVPIMFLDHVTDAMLKGIGEQVYSMWVNISDSFLSVVLICILIPRLGIAGYAWVIIVMEGYNFALSFARLRRRIRFRFKLLSSLFVPLMAAGLAALAADRAFAFSGELAAPLWLCLKMIFAASLFGALSLGLRLLSGLCRKGRLALKSQ